jgi:hypothetical protein
MNHTNLKVAAVVLTGMAVLTGLVYLMYTTFATRAGVDPNVWGHKLDIFVVVALVVPFLTFICAANIREGDRRRAAAEERKRRRAREEQEHGT